MGMKMAMTTLKSGMNTKKPALYSEAPVYVPGLHYRNFILRELNKIYLTSNSAAENVFSPFFELSSFTAR